MGEKETVDEAFFERNLLAALYADGWYWHDDWKVLVINHSLAGQLTYHVPPSFDTRNIPEIKPCWDGTTTEQKNARIHKAIAQQSLVRRLDMAERV